MVKTDNRYNFYTLDLYTKGYLKGYINGLITFRYNNDEYNHEFLFRITDPENGKDNDLVSIDYGYKIPYIEEVWSDIEEYLTQYALTHNN